MTVRETRPGSSVEQEGRNRGIFFGSYRPPRILTNEEIASWNVPTASGKILAADDISQKVGVQTRRIANNDETVLAMGIAASSAIVDQTGRAIDAVLFTTSYPTGRHNATAIIETLGLSSNTALDIHAACSGGALALTYLKDNENRLAGKRILIVGSEKYSATLPNLQLGDEDPSLSQTIFTDGAQAMSFVYGEDLEIVGYKRFERDAFPPGSEEAIRMPIDERLVQQPALVTPVPPSETGKFFMDGNKVYKTMRQGHPQQVMQTLGELGVSPDEVSLIIPHQASLPMLSTVKSGLGDLGEKVFFDLERGNLSSASIIRAFERTREEGRVQSGDIVVFDGFGAGFYSAVVVAKIL